MTLASSGPPDAARSEPRGRIPGRRVARILVLAIATIIGVTLALFFVNREPKGPILALRAVPDGGAVVLRGGFEARDTMYLVRYDASGKQQWSEALFGVQSGGSPWIVDDFVAVPAHDARGRPATQVFTLADGRFIFRADPLPPGVPNDTAASYANYEGRLYELYAGEPGRLSVYDPSSGERLKTSPAPSGVSTLEAVDGTIVASGARYLQVDPSNLEMRDTEVAVPSSPEPVRTEDGCVVWTIPRGRVSVASSMLESGRRFVVGSDTDWLLASGQGAAFTLVVVDDDGELRAAHVAGPSALTLRDEHVAAGFAFIHSERDLVGIEVATLSIPSEYRGKITIEPVPVVLGDCVSAIR